MHITIRYWIAGGNTETAEFTDIRWARKFAGLALGRRPDDVSRWFAVAGSAGIHVTGDATPADLFPESSRVDDSNPLVLNA